MSINRTNSHQILMAFALSPFECEYFILNWFFVLFVTLLMMVIKTGYKWLLVGALANHSLHWSLSFSLILRSEYLCAQKNKTHTHIKHPNDSNDWPNGEATIFRIKSTQRRINIEANININISMESHHWKWSWFRCCLIYWIEFRLGCAYCLLAYFHTLSRRSTKMTSISFDFISYHLICLNTSLQTVYNHRLIHYDKLFY